MRLDEETYARLQQRNVEARMQGAVRRSGTPANDDLSPAARTLGSDGTGSAKADGKRANAAIHCPESGVVMLPYPISANRYWRNFRGRMVVSSEARAYKARVIEAFDARGKTPMSKDVALSLKLHPKLTTNGKASRTLIDLDNCIKVCLDALQGALYVNDKQVKKLAAEIGEPVINGGLSVRVEQC